MEIIQKEIEDIRPYGQNPRINDSAVEQVANSIMAFGFQQPIVLDKDGVIIAGHTRYKAALKLALKEVPCIIADGLSDAEARAYRLADNKTAEHSRWDKGKLAKELDAVKPDFNMVDFGFFEAEVFPESEAALPPLPEPVAENEDRKLRCPRCGHIDFADAFKEVGK